MAAPTNNAPLNFTWPEEGHTRVPYWVYTAPEIYQREMEVIFGGPAYSFIGFECEIPNPGDFRQTKVGDKPVIYTRDEDGTVRVFANRCAHRGVQFCYDTHGKGKTEFICPYHQWTYNLKGDVIAIPFRRGIRKQGHDDEENASGLEVGGHAHIAQAKQADAEHKQAGGGVFEARIAPPKQHGANNHGGDNLAGLEHNARAAQEESVSSA